MASSGQRCPLCNGSLLKYLVNPDGDYMLNCSSLTCLYGVLHAEVHHANGEHIATSASTVHAGCVTAQPCSGLEESYEDNGTTETPKLHSASSNIPDPSTDSDDNMINSWVEELMQQSIEMNTDSARCTTSHAVCSPSESSECSSSYCGSTSSLAQPPPSPSVAAEAGSVQPVLPTSPNLPTDLVAWSNSQSTTTNPSATEAVKATVTTARTATTLAARKTRQQPMRNMGKLPHTRTTQLAKLSSMGKLVERKLSDKTAKSHWSPTRPRQLTARLQRTQAFASTLRTHLSSGDDFRSEASSDSGIQSDASSDRSCSSSLTPIQRLLHIEEAKKRSWGVTGLSGYKPLSSRSRSSEVFC